MTWVAVGVGVAGAAVSIGSSLMGSKSADKAAKAQARELAIMRGIQDDAANEIQGYADNYKNTIDSYANNFDPYEMEQAFNSLYEGVIQPMERDFDQNVLPGIQAAYSGGVMGAEAGLSGAHKEAESGARMDLLEKKADLRYQERGQAIQRNYIDYDQRVNLAGKKLQAETLAPNMRAGNSVGQFQAASETIGTQLSGDLMRANALNQGMQGFNTGVSTAQNVLELREKGQGTPTKPATPGGTK